MTAVLQTTGNHEILSVHRRGAGATAVRVAVVAIVVAGLVLKARAWGAQAGGGLEAVVRLQRTAFHPGELLRIEGLVRNTGSQEVKVPGAHTVLHFNPVEVHVVTPGGEDFRFAPTFQGGCVVLPVTTAVAAGKELSVFHVGLRLTDGLGGWSSREHPEGPMSLRAAGSYRVWFRYEVPEKTRDMWTGKVVSGKVEFSVSALPPEQRRDEPTAEQLAAIKQLQEAAPGRIDGRESLWEEMLRAENEGLAMHLVELCAKNSPREMDFMEMLRDRACAQPGRFERLLLGIDGPYLKRLAGLTLDILEHPPADANKGRMFRSGSALEATIAYLRFHPEDRAWRERLVKPAVASAKLPPSVGPGHIAKPALGPGPQTRPAGRREETPLTTPAAWEVLLELEVLRPGMSVEEAKEILGPPSGSHESWITWYIDTPRHVNPGLRAQVADGKIVSLQPYLG